MLLEMLKSKNIPILEFLSFFNIGWIFLSSHFVDMLSYHINFLFFLYNLTYHYALSICA